MPYSRGPDPSPAFRFHVEIDGVQVARFCECSGLELQAEVFEYKEGGSNSRTYRFPGRFKFGDLTLKKGIATDGAALWDWVTRTVGQANAGRVTTHNVTVTLYDVSGENALRTWVFRGAYPIKWSAGALSAEHSAIAIESLTLAHQGMDFAQ